MYQVIKKDGSLQPFDAYKIKSLVERAGGTAEQGDMVSGMVEWWLPEVAVDGKVSRDDIKEKVLAELDVVNPGVADKIRNFEG